MELPIQPMIDARAVSTAEKSALLDGKLDPVHWGNLLALGVGGYGLVKGNWLLVIVAAAMLVHSQGGVHATLTKLGF